MKPALVDSPPEGDGWRPTAHAERAWIVADLRKRASEMTATDTYIVQQNLYAIADEYERGEHAPRKLEGA